MFNANLDIFGNAEELHARLQQTAMDGRVKLDQDRVPRLDVKGNHSAVLDIVFCSEGHEVGAG